MPLALAGAVGHRRRQPEPVAALGRAPGPPFQRLLHPRAVLVGLPRRHRSMPASPSCAPRTADRAAVRRSHRPRTSPGRTVVGPWVHVPLIVVGFVLALFTRTLGFPWLALLIVAAELLIVISRFVFSYEQALMGDLVRYWYAALFLFASAYTLLRRGPCAGRRALCRLRAHHPRLSQRHRHDPARHDHRLGDPRGSPSTARSRSSTRR